MNSRSLCLRTVILACLLIVPMSQAADVYVIPGDAPGTGFFDPAPATPVGGNPGTTVGDQRLIAFQAAADKWGATLTSSQPILIIAFFTPLPCIADAGVLGAAAPLWDFADVPGIDPGTWYPVALAEKLSGIDLTSFVPPGLQFEIFSFFNSELGQPGCLENGGWYYGLDNNGPPHLSDLFTVVLHELAHGLGFTVNPTDGETGQRTEATPGVFYPSVWERNMLDTTTNKIWLDMTDAERAASAINTGALVWNGGATLADAPAVLDFQTELEIKGPRGVQGVYEAQAASFGAPLGQSGLQGFVRPVYDEGGASPTDGCEPIVIMPVDDDEEDTRPVFLIDRGNCAFTTKVKNAQDAGAVGVVIANNVPVGLPPMGGSDPTIYIPSIGITQELGDAIRALPRFRNPGHGNLNTTMRLSSTIRAGTVNNMPRLYAPNPYEGGSSVSHWDTSASPNQLMEPFINSDLTHEITAPFDLTFSLLADLGW